jgi:hypothetical protein
VRIGTGRLSVVILIGDDTGRIFMVICVGNDTGRISVDNVCWR